MPDLPLITAGIPRERVQARLPDGRIFEAPPGTPLKDIMAAIEGEAALKRKYREEAIRAHTSHGGEAPIQPAQAAE